MASPRLSGKPIKRPEHPSMLRALFVVGAYSPMQFISSRAQEVSSSPVTAFMSVRENF